ncbi:hypothetical protein Leryth_004327 [Lithospermum erythrorhizon]|nr:hypothetical protein Leryth_004327 [Lithospermum erythrorhizon]
MQLLLAWPPQSPQSHIDKSLQFQLDHIEQKWLQTPSTEIVFEHFPLIRVFKDGHVHRFIEANFVQSSIDPLNNILSKDIILSQENNVSVHSWSALKWIVSNAEKNHGSDSEPWLRDHADFSRVFLAGDSTGANIAHNMMVRASTEDSGSFEREVNVMGMALIHPFFGNGQPDKLWDFLCKDREYRLDDPRLNPEVHPKLLKDFYYEGIKNSAWSGEVDIVDTEGEDHVFHLWNPGCDNAAILLKKVAAFMN